MPTSQNAGWGDLSSRQRPVVKSSGGQRDRVTALGQMNGVRPPQTGTGHPHSVCPCGQHHRRRQGHRRRNAAYFGKKQGSSQDIADQAAFGEFRGKGSFLMKGPLVRLAGEKLHIPTTLGEEEAHLHIKGLRAPGFS